MAHHDTEQNSISIPSIKEATELSAAYNDSFDNMAIIDIVENILVCVTISLHLTLVAFAKNLWNNSIKIGW